MERLRYYIRSTLQLDNAPDMQTSLDLSVFEDREHLDGARPFVIRGHFSQWAANASQEEQGKGKFAIQSQRYNCCLHVDRDALQSVINGPAPPADNLGNGFVNLVCRKFLGGMRPEHTYGRDEKDLCWMRITYQDLMATWYNQIEHKDHGALSTAYQARL